MNLQLIITLKLVTASKVKYTNLSLLLPLECYKVYVVTIDRQIKMTYISKCGKYEYYKTCLYMMNLDLELAYSFKYMHFTNNTFD